MEFLFLGDFTHLQALVVIIVECIKGIGVIHHNVKQRLIFVGRFNLLMLDSTSQHLHQLAQFAYLLVADALVDGIALNKIVLQDTISPLAKLDTAL